MILGLKLGVSLRDSDFSFLVRSAVRSFGPRDRAALSGDDAELQLKGYETKKIINKEKTPLYSLFSVPAKRKYSPFTSEEEFLTSFGDFVELPVLFT